MPSGHTLPCARLPPCSGLNSPLGCSTLAGFDPPMHKKDRLTAVENLVEHRGIEPLTSGLQIGPEQAFCIPVCSGFEEPDLWSVFFSIPSLYDTAPSQGSRSQLVGHLWVTLWFTM